MLRRLNLRRSTEPGARDARGFVPARALLLPLAGLAAACAGKYDIPFATRPEPVPYADTLPIAEPEAKDMDERLELFQDAVVRTVRRPVRPEKHQALNLTRFDDVTSGGPSWWPRSPTSRSAPPWRRADSRTRRSRTP